MRILVVLFFICSCSRLSYLTKQGIGQVSLLNSARANQKILSSDKINDEQKEKIRLIVRYKEFFYRYFNRQTTQIYDKTAILDQDAVTYLVIRSKHDEVKAEEECFFWAGCFPYLGFFNINDAKDYASAAQEKGEITYLRPVYAYSSLGHFTDPILSSFFYFDELELADLVFHELFHTIFFIKNEVDLNEAMAEHFSKILSEIYFSSDIVKSNIIKGRRELESKISKYIVSSAKKIQGQYKVSCPCDRIKSKIIFDHFLEKDFYPGLDILCADIKKVNFGECKLKDKEWNNATFAATLTYEDDQEEIEKYFAKQDVDLQNFLALLEKKYQDYQKSKNDSTFSHFLLKS